MTVNRLCGLSRSNAYIRSMGFNQGSNFKQLGSQLDKQVREWIITGEGTPYAEVKSCDIKHALDCIGDINKLSIDDYKLYLEYLITV